MYIKAKNHIQPASITLLFPKPLHLHMDTKLAPINSLLSCHERVFPQIFQTSLCFLLLNDLMCTTMPFPFHPVQQTGYLLVKHKTVTFKT